MPSILEFFLAILLPSIIVSICQTMIPQKFVNIFMTYWREDATKVGPVISTGTAAGLSILLTLIYVLPLYASPLTRPSPTLARDAPPVIRARIRSVTFSVVISGLITIYVSFMYGHLMPVDILEVFGMWPIIPSDILKSLLLLCILFQGPLFETFVVEGGARRLVLDFEAVVKDVGDTLGSDVGLRNYVAAPLSEELLFRSLLLPISMFAWLTPTHLIFLTPLYFGIAHVHHFYEFTLTHPHTPLLPALLRTLVQFAYTSVFGFYASFLYLRIGSVWAVVLAHAFCNWMGLPRVWGRLEGGVVLGPGGANGAGVGVSGPAARARRNSEEEDDDDGAVPPSFATVALDNPGVLGLGWTVAYYILLVAGAVEFGVLLWPLTESTNSLVEFGVKLP